MKRYLLFIALLFCLLRANAQDLNFSQFYEQPLLRNPALLGFSDGDLKITGIFRSQWQSVTVPYQTEGASLEFKSPTRTISYGLQITNDAAGDVQLRRTQILGAFCKRWTFPFTGDLVWQAGIGAGLADTRFDPTKARFDDQFVNGAYDPSNPTSEVFNATGQSYLEVNSGIAVNGSYNTEYGDVNYYFGIAAYHLANPQPPSIGFLQKKYMLNAGLIYPVIDGHDLLVYADFSIQGGNHQLTAGGLGQIFSTDYENKNFDAFIGFIYRYRDAIAPCIKIGFGAMAGSISYDVNISKLSVASQGRGGFELTLSYKGILENHDNLPCPPKFRY